MREQQAAALPAYTGKDLGASWQKDHTVFKLWAPTASAVRVLLYATGSDDEPGAALYGSCPMEPAGQGVWQAHVEGDLAGVYYVYGLQFEGREEEVLTADPYAKACGINGRRSMVIDLASAVP